MNTVAYLFCVISWSLLLSCIINRSLHTFLVVIPKPSCLGFWSTFPWQLLLFAPPLVRFGPGFCIFAAKSLCCAISFVTVKHNIVHSFVYSASKLTNFLLDQLSRFTRMRPTPAAGSPAVLRGSIRCDPDSAHRAGPASLRLFRRAEPLGTALRRLFP